MTRKTAGVPDPYQNSKFQQPTAKFQQSEGRPFSFETIWCIGNVQRGWQND